MTPIVMRHPKTVDVDFLVLNKKPADDAEEWYGYWVSRQSGATLAADNLLVTEPEEWVRLPIAA